APNGADKIPGMKPSGTYHLLLPVSLFFGLFQYVESVQAATVNAASCSQANVQAAIASASNGDTVIVPAGSCTWTSGISLGTKAITLQGAGIGATNITHNISGSQVNLITFAQHATIHTRITGFSFLGGSYDHRMISTSGSANDSAGNATCSAFRIDH